MARVYATHVPSLIMLIKEIAHLQVRYAICPSVAPYYLPHHHQCSPYPEAITRIFYHNAYTYYWDQKIGFISPTAMIDENRHASYRTAVLDHRPRYVNRQQIGKYYKMRTNWPFNALPSLNKLSTSLVTTLARPAILFPSSMTNLDIQRGSHAAYLGQNTSDFTLRHYSMGFQKWR